MEITKKGGCILIDPEKECVALVYRKKPNDYSFPKGHIEEGESLIDCAIRETNEETKREVALVSSSPIHIESYRTPKGEFVEVYYYLGIDNGKSSNRSWDTHPVVWVPFEEVYDKLTYPTSKNTWNAIKDEVAKHLFL